MVLMLIVMFWDDPMIPSGLEGVGSSTPKLKVNHFELCKLHDVQYTLLHLLIQSFS